MVLALAVAGSTVLTLVVAVGMFRLVARMVEGASWRGISRCGFT